MCSCDQNLVTVAFLWEKLSQPQFYKDLTRKTAFFEGWSWFKFNNLGLALGTNFCYTIVAKWSKLKVRKFCELVPSFIEVTGEKLVGGPPPHPIRVKSVHRAVDCNSKVTCFRCKQRFHVCEGNVSSNNGSFQNQTRGPQGIPSSNENNRNVQNISVNVFLKKNCRCRGQHIITNWSSYSRRPLFRTHNGPEILFEIANVRNNRSLKI